MTRSSNREPKGQVLALFAVFLIVLIGATAITVDYGTWLKTRRDYQNVADAAVLAGGGFLSRPIDNTKRGQARHAAWESLNAQLGLGLTAVDIGGADPNDFTDGGLDSSSTLAGTPFTRNGYRLWVSTPPIDASTKYPGSFTAAGARYLFAWVEKDNPSFFSHIFGQGDRTVSAWATAGVFAGQFAVITLRKSGQAGPANATDIDVAGSNTILQVANGDVGGNWGMKLNSGSSLYLVGDADAYLQDYVSCGNSCWSANQVSDGFPTFNLKTVQQLPNFVDDPNYPLPAVVAGAPDPLVTGPIIGMPQGSGTGTSNPNIGDLTLSKGTISGTGCTATSPHIGPGWYHDIVVNGCVILDPVHNYSDPDDSNNDGNFGMTDVPSTQRPGIFYITGQLNVGTNAEVVGDGVSLVFRKDGNRPGLKTTGSAIVDINTGATDGVKGFPPNLKKAAFQSDGSYSYTFNTTTNVWQYSANNADPAVVGVAVYVIKPDLLGNLAADANTDLVQINAGAALSWQGVLYAPHDNITLSGQPLHDAIGQFICWTVKLAGGTTVTQTYDGPGEAAPRLVEPRLGQ